MVNRVVIMANELLYTKSTYSIFIYGLANRLFVNGVGDNLPGNISIIARPKIQTLGGRFT